MTISGHLYDELGIAAEGEAVLIVGRLLSVLKEVKVINEVGLCGAYRQTKN